MLFVLLHYHYGCLQLFWLLWDVFCVSAYAQHGNKRTILVTFIDLIEMFYGTLRQMQIVLCIRSFEHL